MGEIADMMLDGTMCQMCGVFIEDGPLGYPGYCSEACKRDHLGDDVPDAPVQTLDERKPAQCPDCDRRFKNGNALGQHWDAKHGG